MAVDMFLKLSNSIDGESRDDVHKNEIDVLAWSWGMTQSGSMHVLGGGGSGKVSVQDLSVTKYVDKATSNLIKACCNGEHIATAKLTVRKAGKTPLEYIVLELTDVLITAVSTGGSGGEDRLTENVTLNFAKFKITYKSQSATGGEEASVPASWDIAANKE